MTACERLQEHMQPLPHDEAGSRALAIQCNSAEEVEGTLLLELSFSSSEYVVSELLSEDLKNGSGTL